MRKALAILMLVWVFLLAPAFCLGAIGTPACACGQAECHDCQSQPGEPPHSHGGRHDPCPKDVCRTDPDETSDARLSAGPSQTAGSLVFSMGLCFVPVIANDGIDVASPESDAGAALQSTRMTRFALNGLPLLI